MKFICCLIVILFPVVLLGQTYSTSSGGQRSQTNRAYVAPVVTKTYTMPTPKASATQYQAPSSSSNNYRTPSNNSGSSSSSSSGSSYSPAPERKVPTTSLDFYDLGIKEMTWGSKEQAIVYFEKAVSLNPLHAQSFLSMGLIKAKTGDFKTAEEYFTKSIMVSPQYDLAYSGRGDARFELEKFEGAIADYDKALSIQVNVKDYHMRANSKYNSKNYSGAIIDYTASIATFDEVQEGYDIEKRGGKPKPKKTIKDGDKKAYREIEGDPMYINSFYYRGLAQSQIGNYKAALEDYEHAATINNNDPYGYFLKGNIRLDMGQNDEAIIAFNKALEIDPGYVKAKKALDIAKGGMNTSKPATTFQGSFDRGVALQDDSKHAEAIVEFNNAIVINPTNAMAYAERGYCKKSLNQYEEAIADFTNAIAIEPKMEMSYYNRGVCYFKIDAYNDAITDFLKAVELNPLSEQSFSMLAATYVYKKDQKSAIANYDKAINLKPTPTLFLKRGKSKGSSQIKDFAGAIADYNKAIQLKPDFPEAYNFRALAKRELKDFDAAIADLDKALVLLPDYTEAIYNLKITKLIKEVLSENK